MTSFVAFYCNICFNLLQGLAHFGFMHMIGSSLCFWIATIVRETVLALTLYANSKYGNRTNGYDAEVNIEPGF